jgi:hypothetical protein
MRLNAEEDNTNSRMSSSLAASIRDEMADAGYPLVQLIFGKDDVAQCDLKLCDNSASTTKHQKQKLRITTQNILVRFPDVGLVTEISCFNFWNISLSTDHRKGHLPL